MLEVENVNVEDSYSMKHNDKSKEYTREKSGGFERKKRLEQRTIRTHAVVIMGAVRVVSAEQVAEIHRGDISDTKTTRVKDC